MNRKNHPMHHALTALGLSHHPFDPDGPLRGFLRTPVVDLFCRRVAYLAQRGGFALLSGAPGVGKSVALRLLADDLRRLGPERTVAILERPQASVADFYRELGHLYGVTLTPHNRWTGAARLRKAWRTFAEEACLQAVLLIDEAQELSDPVLAELRLMAGERLDAGWLLTVVLAGDDRLGDRLRTATLAPLASRLRIRMRVQEQSAADLAAALTHLLEIAGNPAVFTDDVIATLAEQATGNFRTLMHLADQLLTAAIETGATTVDQHLLLSAAAEATTAATASVRRGQPQRRSRA